jgi:hypothetical protein
MAFFIVAAVKTSNLTFPDDEECGAIGGMNE